MYFNANLFMNFILTFKGKKCIIDKLFYNFFSRVTERANPYFVLQQRKGYGTKGLTSLFVGTMDSVFDTKVSKILIISEVILLAEF